MGDRGIMSILSIVTDVVERVRALVFRRAEDRELAEELRFHIEMEEDYRRRSGASDAEARRGSLIALGGIERVKEDVRDARGTRLIEDAVADVAYAARGLARAPGFTAVAILTLAVGIGGTTAVFSAVDAVLLQPLPYSHPGQLVRLYQNSLRKPNDRGFVTPVHYAQYRDHMASFAAAASIATYGEQGGDIVTPGGVERIHLLTVGADYLDVLRVPPAIGRGFQRRDEEHGGLSQSGRTDADRGARVVLLSNALWVERFAADPAAVGRTLTINGAPYVVCGVMPDGFRDPVVPGVQAWIPMNAAPGRDASNADNHYLGMIARLRPETSIERAQAELEALSLRLAQQFPHAKDIRARLYPLKEDIVGESSRALQLMFAAALVVLVLVCVNLANLLLVRGSEREREFALRAALGAERTRLVRQLLVESVVLAIVGDIAAIGVARAAMSAIVALAGGAIPRLAHLSLEPRVLGFSLGLATLSAVGFGLLPAIRASRVDPNETLRGESRASTSDIARGRLRTSLVVAQVALAFVLIVCAGMLITSVRHLGEVDLGISPANVLAFELNLPDARYDAPARARTYEEVAHRIEQLPGVQAAGGISKLPATGAYNQWGVTILSGPLANDPQRWIHGGTENRVVSGDYFRAVGMRLLHGRLFDARDDASAPHRMIVSKNFADAMYPGVDPVGQRLESGGPKGEIIGVVNDVVINAEGAPDKYIYHAHTQFAADRNWELSQVVATTGSPTAIVSAVRGTIAAIDPQLVVYRPAPLTDVIGRGTAQRVFVLRLLTSFAAIALGLAALGLFGVLSYGVKLRTREFCIRMALGAESTTIRRMVLREGLVLTAIGLFIGVGGATVSTKLLTSLLFRVKPLEPTVLIAAGAVMAIVAMSAAYVPAWRATIVDPRSALQ
jgi:putative ABC transport system permease protein